MRSKLLKYLTAFRISPNTNHSFSRNDLMAIFKALTGNGGTRNRESLGKQLGECLGKSRGEQLKEHFGLTLGENNCFSR